MLVYGDRVRSARLLRGLAANKIADVAGWSQATQTRLEASSSQEVVDEQVQKLAAVLRVPESYFRIAPPPALSSTELLFRAPVRTTKREKDYLAEYARLVGEMLDWLDNRHRLPPVKLSGIPHAGAVRAASLTRLQLGLDPEDPITHLTHRVERAGVVIVVRDTSRAMDNLRSVDDEGDDTPVNSALHEDHDAYSTRVGLLRDRPLVVARAHDSWERTRLTIAHEVGHLVLHDKELPPNAEKKAYEFAAELLAPAAAVGRMLQEPVTLASLVPVKLHFGISLSALIRHLFRSNLISEDRYRKLGSQIHRRHNPETGVTWGKREPGWDLQSPERPFLLRTWFERCAGTSVPNAIFAGALRHIPVDVIASTLSGQRRSNMSAQGSGRLEQSAQSSNRRHQSTESDGSVVINLAARRKL